MISAYRTIAVVLAVNGLKADEHEFTITPQGSAYVLAYSPVLTDLSSVGGPASGLAVDGVIQQSDIHPGLVRGGGHRRGQGAPAGAVSNPAGRGRAQ